MTWEELFLAGPELGAGVFISDTAPEDKARELLAIPVVNYEQADGNTVPRAP